MLDPKLIEITCQLFLQEKIIIRMEEREMQKREREEEKKELARLWELIREDEMNKLKKAHERRENLQKQLEEQITISNGFLAERARQEAEVDRMFNAIVEAEIAKEKSDIRETSAALRREMLAYLGYLQELREEDVKRNIEMDALIEEHNKKVEAKRQMIKKKAEETRQQKLRELIRGREEQMKEKREAEERERQMLEEEKILLEQELARDAKLTEEEKKKRWEESRLYKKELIEQMKYMESRRNRDKEETERIYNDGLKRESEYDKFINELINFTETIKPHPFKMVLKQ